MRRIASYTLLAVLVFMFSYGLHVVQEQFAYSQTRSSIPGKKLAIPVLAYHSVSATARGEYNITPGKFAEQMKYLADHGYTTLTIGQFGQAIRGGGKPAGKPVLITFDDGYANNYKVAYPIMRQYGFTAALFVITGWLGSGPYLTWEQAMALHQAGWDIMPHSRTHPHLPLLGREQQKQEIAGAKETVERKIGSPATAFAYPYGQRNDTTYELVRSAGFALGFTFDDGLTDSGQNPLLLKRRIITGQESIPEFAHKLEADNPQ